MPDLFVRDISAATVDRLKTRAKEHRRSLQGEVKAILDQAAAKLSMDEMRQTALSWQRRLKGRRFSDSTRLIREDRDR